MKINKKTTPVRQEKPVCVLLFCLPKRERGGGGLHLVLYFWHHLLLIAVLIPALVGGPKKVSAVGRRRQRHNREGHVRVPILLVQAHLNSIRYIIQNHEQAGMDGGGGGHRC